MTIGIALKDKKNHRIIIGTDRQATLGDEIQATVKKKYVCRELEIIDGYENVIGTRKIYFILAGWGFLDGFLEYKFKIPPINENINFIDYLYTCLLSDLKTQLMDEKLLGLKEDKFNSESNVLIIYDGEIYELTNSFGIDHVHTDYAVIWSGWKVAIGSLYTNLHYHQHLNRVNMVQQAIISCGVNTIYCDTNSDIHIIYDYE
ncbi:MAG: hypothetical protein IJH63_00870 [Methanobrevibacter sp.]|nr:hypothetical protein [Methanosphaera sp.]MBR0369257.1 hypothetical protein [Methanobrevibacter sp.]